MSKETAVKETDPRTDTNARPGEEPNNTENETIIFQTETISSTEDEEKDNEALPRDKRHQQDQDDVKQNYKLLLLKETYD